MCCSDLCWSVNYRYDVYSLVKTCGLQQANQQKKSPNKTKKKLSVFPVKVGIQVWNVPNYLGINRTTALFHKS